MNLCERIKKILPEIRPMSKVTYEQHKVLVDLGMEKNSGLRASKIKKLLEDKLAELS